MNQITYIKNRHLRNDRFEKKSHEPSMTVPMQSIPMTEIMQRFLRGQSLPIGMNTHFDGEDGEVDFDNVDPTQDPSFDLADYTQLNEEIKEKQRARADKKTNKENPKDFQTRESEAKGVNEVTERSGVDELKPNGGASTGLGSEAVSS